VTDTVAGASRPAILAVDDDPDVLAAVDRDLRRRYAASYRVVRADSAAAALDVLKELKRRAAPVALLLVDQRMPGMTGVELLEEAKQLYPAAKTVLLTAYADTDAAIRAINTVRLDYYVLKPWDPPEERLYPPLDDLLDDWQAGFRPPFEGVRLVGNRWSPEAHRLRDFLGRNQVPYEWLDVEGDDEGARLVASVGDRPELPALFLPDGRHLARPSNVEVAEAVGLRSQPETPFYDLLIVGGGPAGLAAAVYGASEGLRTALLEREAPGGQAGSSSRIENYLGFPQGLSGAELARRALAQARKFAAEILVPREVRSLEVRDPYRVVVLEDGSELSCNALIVATGVAYRRLAASGIEGLTGAGVYYGAASTEAWSCRDDDVFIVGGANSAGQAALYLASVARSVTLVVRGQSVEATMSQYLVDAIEATPNVTVRHRSALAAVAGDGHVERVIIRDLDSGEETEMSAAAVFVFIGAEPRTEWLEGVVERDGRGFILTGADVSRKSWPEERDPYLLETSVPGVFAVGDVRARSVKRVASAVGEGSIAVQFVHQYLNG
jgi:thioredoxin reductase (NADPH)